MINTQSKQKPYGYLKLSNAKFYHEVEGVVDIDNDPDYLPVYTHSQPKQEPAAWGMEHPDGDIIDVITPEEHAREEGGYRVALYREPQPKRNVACPCGTATPREWVGLTDEERGQAINANFGTGLWRMAKDIEAKLKAKNFA